MAFFGAGTTVARFTVRGALVGLRPLQMPDYAAWAALRDQSRTHLQPFEPEWPADELMRGSFRRRLKHYAREQQEDLGYSFGIFTLAGHQLVGGISLSNVRRGVTQAAQLGYWLGAPHVRKGYMADAVALILNYTFHGLRLHRVEAATLPDNAVSIRVLERNGFVREGYARQYLNINGVWSDHILFACLASDHLDAARHPRGAAKAKA